MSGRRKTGGVFIGVSSLLVIFIVLCLTTFAALSLASANADLKMARRAAQAVSDYYAADSRAVELLVQADAAVEADPVRPQAAGVTFQRRGRALVASYAVPISDAQELRVEVRYPGPGDTRHEILQWQAASTREWQGDEAIELWDGTL